MAPTERRTLIIPLDLGPASKYDPVVFPVSSYRGKGSLARGGFLLEATLDELLRMKAMAAALSQNDDFIITTKAKYDELIVKKNNLEDQPKTLNPFKFFTNYRAIRLLYGSIKSLYRQTKRTSERMKGGILSVPSEDVKGVQGTLPPGAKLYGLVITTDDEEAVRTVTDAANMLASSSEPLAENPLITRLTSVSESMLSNSDPLSVAAVNEAAAALGAANRTSNPSSSSQTSESTSEGSGANASNVYYIRDSVGITFNHCGSQNSGCVNNEIQFAPETPPSASP
ncbi:hypothetical protein PAXINDRAFT_172903 [Paxillus involutus ATCC 200175]|uniref:Uncharacterized protein n=1 Tax=Paxillus involutus ATCC 200175 TaxID=664439 RepID=A0A0C9SZ03_PAXIN|nr:hypothetical protein PAXINDRAFT_172903 [Paxillus involutus ATCC 200175]